MRQDAPLTLKSFEFRREREAAWHELDGLVGTVERRGIRALSPDQLLRLPGLYRAALSSLSVARAISLDRNVVAYLESLAGRAYLCVYATPGGFLAALRGFFTVAFPAAVRAARRPIALATACVLLGFIVSFVMTLQNPDAYYAFRDDDGRAPTSSLAELEAVLFEDGDGVVGRLAAFASFLFTHNAAIGLLAFALGFAFGLPVFFLMFLNGLNIGALAAIYHTRGLSLELWGWLLIHGTTELLALFLLGGAGLVLGGAVAFPAEHGRLDTLKQRGRGAGQLALGAVFMLFVAGFLEGFGRQTVLDTAWRYGIGGAMLAVWLLYFTRAGRGHRG